MLVYRPVGLGYQIRLRVRAKAEVRDKVKARLSVEMESRRKAGGQLGEFLVFGSDGQVGSAARAQCVRAAAAYAADLELDGDRAGPGAGPSAGPTARPRDGLELGGRATG